MRERPFVAKLLKIMKICKLGLLQRVAKAQLPQGRGILIWVIHGLYLNLQLVKYPSVETSRFRRMITRKYNLINNVTGWIIFAIALVTYWLTLEPTAS